MKYLACASLVVAIASTPLLAQEGDEQLEEECRALVEKAGGFLAEIQDEKMTHREALWRQRGEALKRKLEWLFTRTKARK